MLEKRKKCVYKFADPTEEIKLYFLSSLAFLGIASTDHRESLKLYTTDDCHSGSYINILFEEHFILYFY